MIIDNKHLSRRLKSPCITLSKYISEFRKFSFANVVFISTNYVI